MTTLLAALASIVGVTVMTAVLIGVSSIVNGFVLSVLWKWFMVPTFGLTPLSIPAAIGIAMVVSYLTYIYSDPAPNPDSKWWKPLVFEVVRQVVVLVFGYVVHCFV